MSIEQLRGDLEILSNRLSTEPPETTADLVRFLRDELLPWQQAQVDEMGEMDDVIDDMVHESADVLHSDNAGVFAMIITGGLELAKELAARAGNDKRILDKVKAFREIAKAGETILEDITIDDPDDEEGDGEGEGEGEDPAPNGGAVVEGKAP